MTPEPYDLAPTAPRPAGLAGGPVYLDYNATTPVDPRVLDAVLPYLREHFGNPSSRYRYGTAARDGLEQARSEVGALLGAPPGSSVVFTGSGSEADALAVRGAALAHPGIGPWSHVITQATEHPAVLAAVDDLRDLHGFRVTVLPVDADGLVDPDAVAAAITEHTVLVSVMHANNETGVLQPVAEIAEVAHRHGVLVHCDAAQSVGKVPVDVTDLGVDLLTVVGHKVYAPKGIAALWVAPDVPLRPVVGGGGQEHGLRAGTENVAYAVGLGRAATVAAESLRAGERDRLHHLRERLHTGLRAALPDRVYLNGHHEHRLPNTLNVSIDGTRALTVLDRLDEVAASAGSACHSGEHSPSPVLTAMGLSTDRVMSALRLSLGRWSTADEVDAAVRAITVAVDGCSSDAAALES